MNIRFYYTSCLLLLCLCSFRQAAMAQFEEGRRTCKLDTFSVYTTGAADTNTHSYSGDESAQVDRKISDILTFKIKEQSDAVRLSGFTATINYSATLTRVIGSSTPEQVNSQVVLTYDTVTGSKNDVRIYRVFDNYERVFITINSVTISNAAPGWDPRYLISIAHEMAVTRYYNMSSTTAMAAPGFIDEQDFTDALKLSWSWASTVHNNISQLEWAWVENEMKPFYNLPAGADNLFLNNSTRVDLDYDTFRVPLLYPGAGTLYYRVRPALRKNDGFVIPGTWSAVDTFNFAGHQANLNWQSSTSFAENGKYKAVIQYFDGSLRGRQTVTKDNEKGNTVVGETIYDLQGRPNVQILPTPTINSTIQYFTNFNRFEDQLDNTEDPAKYFDLTPANVQCNASPKLDARQGNGRYYSINNDWMPDGYYDISTSRERYLPSSEGYGYTETRFMDDATERVSVQGGVGANHQIGSGHETRYFYGKPSQHELDAVFGTEVGDASHYSKNMVQDANGQMSVSYVDMHGRTIATALAGKSPNGMDSIRNDIDYPQATGLLTNQLLTPSTNIIKDNSIQSLSTILVPALTDYNFSYSLNPAVLSQFSTTANKQICFDCKYDLEISIRKEDCADGTPIVKKYSNLQLVAADQACGTAMGFVGEGITTPTNMISFTQALSAGSWAVRKTLTINDSMFAIRKDSALKVFLLKSQQTIYNAIYSELSTSSGCNLPAGNTAACDACLTQLGNYSTYETKYLAAIGNPQGYSTSIIKSQFTQDSLACVEACGHSVAGLSTLANLRNQLLADMMPFTGQYAIDSVRNTVTGLATAISPDSAESKYNIFTTAPSVSGKVKPFYRNPFSETTGSVSNYYTIDNTIDSSLMDGNTYRLPTLSRDEFADLFQSTWAKSLIVYHPEYSKLKFAEDSLKGAYDWLDKVQMTERYGMADTAGYLSPLASDAYFSYSITDIVHDKDTMGQYITGHVPGGSSPGSNPSIWQIANGSVLCGGLSDTQKSACILGTTATGLSTSITTTVDKDKVWQRFKSLYLNYRNEMVIRYINKKQSAVLSAAEMKHLQDEHKQLAFATNQQVANQNGSGNWWSLATNITAADTARLRDSVNAYVTANGLNPDKCAGQKPYWRQKLLQCEQLIGLLNKNTPGDSVTVNIIIDSILNGMVKVCQHSQTALQPYGASTVNPDYTGTPQSFEAVINQVFAQNSIVNNIADSNYFCNPFTVDAPKPFGTNTPLFVNYSTQIDSCNCGRFAALKSLASKSGGYNTNSFSSMNQFFAANYHDTLTLALWQSLQNCSQLYTDTCHPTTLLKNIAFPSSLAGNTNIKSVSINPGLEFSQANTCLVYAPINLSSPVVIPAFLNCGYQPPCISCFQIANLTTEFVQLYPAYDSVPYRGPGTTDVQEQRNRLWARFLNFRTGFSLNALDYIDAYGNCNGTATGYIGNGADCGTGTAVDSLLVNARAMPFGDTYTARTTIEFVDGFDSNTGDEFVTNINASLSTCSNNYGIAGTPLSGSGGNSNYVLCAFDKPLNDITNLEPTDTLPCRQVQTQAEFLAMLVFNKQKDSLTANFDSLYLSKCLQAKNTEQFYATYQPLEYHYTLYYYDQAGNLVKTLPPAAVKPNFDTAYLATVQRQRMAVLEQASSNNELIATHYRYNTLNQVIAQKTPDAGISKFWYDRLGRLAISQNAKQATANQYGYTLYDVLGRITEVGQRPNTTAMTQTISQDSTQLKNWVFNNAAGNREQITLTVYDKLHYAVAGAADTDPGELKQKNLRNRVSYSMVIDNASQISYTQDGSVMGANAASYYSYDIHGNVDTLLQDYGNASVVSNKMNTPLGNRFKRIAYNYDLISGKVNLVSYQPKKPDQFYHHYEYDAENRLTSVQTSRDSIYWEQDAAYEYYRHGPLARTVLGQNQVQGLDYAYTIQGWLKTVNGNGSGQSGEQEMGQDGFFKQTGYSPHTGENTKVARDAFHYMLNYYEGDYIPVNSPSYNLNVFSGMPSSLPSGNTGTDLFNGNIKSMLVGIPSLSNQTPYLYGYRYDQLNRLVAMDAFTVAETASSNYINDLQRNLSYTATSDYRERISYDPNGNIKTYWRNGQAGTGTDTLMDKLTYQYEKNSTGLLTSNKLRYIHDQVGDGNYTVDLDKQTSLDLTAVGNDKSSSVAGDNYQYDAIGNLIKDVKENIDNIEWTVYGKIKTIHKTDGTTINYTYDASGNRISKTVTTSTTTTGTYYVRDASGNTMSVYTSGNTAVNSGHLTQSEIHLYGSSRLGVLNTSLDAEGSNSAANIIFTRGNKFFELSNHLGNVLVTISDKKIGVDQTNDGHYDYYKADVVTANDYYPFGMQMPGRKYSQANTSYRYGFNGKENDNDVKGDGNQQDYGMRIYDPRIGKFLSVDPITAKYPELTTYQFASNRPIDGIDMDGLEFFKASESNIIMRVDYSPKLKIITGAETVYRMGDNLPPKLKDAIKESNAYKVSIFNVVFKSPLISTQEEARANDVDQRSATGPDMSTMPIISKNKVEERLQRKTKEYSKPIFNEGGVEKGAAGLAVIELTGQVLEQVGIYHLESIINTAIHQSAKLKDITNIIQAGIDNNKIGKEYLNSGSLSNIGNYLLNGADILKYQVIDGKGEYVIDKDLMDISKELWKDYLNSSAKERFQKDLENSKKPKVDNTGRRD